MGRSLDHQFSTSMTVNAYNSDGDALVSDRNSSMESVKRSMGSQPEDEDAEQSLNSMDELYYKNHHPSSNIMDKKLVIVLVAAGSLALFFMLVVGAILPDDGEFGAKGGVTTSNIDIESHNNINNNNYRIVPLPPEDIGRLCDDTFISSPHGYAICRQACKFSECCMLNSEVEGSCLFGDNRKVCALYQKSCEKVYQDDQEKKKKGNNNNNATSQQIIQNITTTTNTTIHMDKTSLENICSNEHLSTDEGQIKCYDACKPAMCCFKLTNNSTSSCDDNNNTETTKAWCKMFTPCSKVSFLLSHQNLRKRMNGF